MSRNISVVPAAHGAPLVHPVAMHVGPVIPGTHVPVHPGVPGTLHPTAATFEQSAVTANAERASEAGNAATTTPEISQLAATNLAAVTAQQQAAQETAAAPAEAAPVSETTSHEHEHDHHDHAHEHASEAPDPQSLPMAGIPTLQPNAVAHAAAEEGRDLSRVEANQPTANVNNESAPASTEASAEAAPASTASAENASVEAPAATEASTETASTATPAATEASTDAHHDVHHQHHAEALSGAHEVAGESSDAAAHDSGASS